MTRKIIEQPPHPTEQEQVRAFSPVLVREMPSRSQLVLDFPRWAWDAIRHWDDDLTVSGAEYYECSGLWISTRWLQELECSSSRPGVSPLGAQLLIELYERGHFGGDETRESASESLRDYARSGYTRDQYVELISRVDAIYEGQYRTLLRNPERIRMRRISFQMLEDVFAAHGKPEGDASLKIGGVLVARQALVERSHLIHKYSWVAEDGEVRGRERAVCLVRDR